jgi:hypothetical protein
MNAGTVRWRSSRPDVASVDATTGNVTAMEPGTTEIIAVADGIEGRASLRVEQPAPPQDSATDLAELSLLTRLSTGSAAMSAEEARDVARRAIALYDELREARNRTEAARVALRASAAAGGSTEACRLLARVTGLTARESEFFRTQNRCP